MRGSKQNKLEIEIEQAIEENKLEIKLFQTKKAELLQQVAKQAEIVSQLVKLEQELCLWIEKNK